MAGLETSDGPQHAMLRRDEQHPRCVPTLTRRFFWSIHDDVEQVRDEHVEPGVAEQLIEAIAADERVVALGAAEDVVASTAVDGVVAAAGGEVERTGYVARRAVERADVVFGRTAVLRGDTISSRMSHSPALCTRTPRGLT